VTLHSGIVSQVFNLKGSRLKNAAERVPSPKTMRISPHTIITRLQLSPAPRAGVDLNAIRARLGHVSLHTTNIYTDTDLALKAKALAACDPVGGHRRIKKKWRKIRT
jgi:integrase/recombinase XerD